MLTVTDKKLEDYCLEKYISDVEKTGLKKTWDKICQFVIDNHKNIPEFLDVKNFGELYEIGLAIQDKLLKKKRGQYYTPDDVALVMSQWLSNAKGTNVCDVGCGTGKLILTYLDLIGFEKARELISSKNLFLFDFDEIALKICKTAISVVYGLDIAEKINTVHCDFLDASVKLPDDCKVISNPPYAKISQIKSAWKCTDVISDTKEYYSAFIEKIIAQSTSSVIISPFSFISGSKFYSLRKKMSECTGFIVAFDNVPGNIFCGRKHGIFNTNTANSVRAAITVTTHNKKQKGYRITPLIRFKQTERENLLKCDTLENFLNPTYQTVNEKNKMFYKCHKDLADVFDKWRKTAKGKTLSDYVCNRGKYIISMPNTCRYYTTASSDIMKRNGQIVIYLNDEKIFNYVYCMINSSFAYWFWRIYDGGITYPRNLLMQLPLFYESLSDDDNKFFKSITSEMLKKSKDYIVTKNNVGIQENIKFPRKYRDKINSRLLKILGTEENEKIFDIIHSNMAVPRTVLRT